MTNCSDGHLEIQYEGEFGCPYCESLAKIIDSDIEIEELREKITYLEGELDERELEIDSLNMEIENLS